MGHDPTGRTPRGEEAGSASIVIRDADERDLPTIAGIFNLEIAESPFVYAETPLSLDDRRSWLQMHRSAGLPVVVATRSGRLDRGPCLGVTVSVPGGERLPVHAGSERVRRARGASPRHRTSPGAVLDDAARARGVHAVVASIDSENTPSIALFERFGYVEAARLTEVGRKFDQWRTQLLLLKLF